MLSFERDLEAQAASARFGSIVDGNGFKVPLPTFAPATRMRYEARAARRLVDVGAEVPALVIPLSTRREILAELAPILRNPRQTVLFEEPGPQINRLVIPDLETEAFAFSCDARRALAADPFRPPKVIRELLNSGLTGNPKSGRLETGRAWIEAEAHFGAAAIASWMAKLQSQARSLVFLAPTPIVRAESGSAARAFDLGWKIVDTVQETAFQGRGLQILLHSDLFRDSAPAEGERKALIDGLRKLHSSRLPRNGPYIALKIADLRHVFGHGPQRGVALSNLKELLCSAAEHVHLADGWLILLNFGTWALAGWDCGADIVSARGTGDQFNIDSHFGIKRRARKHRFSGGDRFIPMRTPPSLRVHPFDPVRLCDASAEAVASLWRTHQSALVAEHVEPREWADLDMDERREYRAMQVYGSLLELARLLRESAKSKVPVRDSVRDRVSRMRDQDIMFSLAPSLEGER